MPIIFLPRLQRSLTPSRDIARKVEAMAQLGGLICLQEPCSDGQGTFFFGGVDGVSVLGVAPHGSGVTPLPTADNRVCGFGYADVTRFTRCT